MSKSLLLRLLSTRKKIPPHQLSFLIPPRGHLKSVKYLDIKIVQTLVANIMLMISPLIWVKLMLFSSKWENMFDLKYSDPSILLYLASTYSIWAQNCSTIQRVIFLQKNAIRVINFQPRKFHGSPYSNKTSF